MASVIRWFAGTSQARELDQIESSDPAELIRSGKHPFQVTLSEVAESRLDPPLYFRQWPGVWPLETLYLGQESGHLEIESTESLETALNVLPPVRRDEAQS